MSNIYTHFCETLRVRSREEQDWVVSLCKALNEEEEPAETVVAEGEAEPVHNVARRISKSTGIGWPCPINAEPGVHEAMSEVTKDQLVVTLWDDGGCGDPLVAGLVVQEYFRRFELRDKRFVIQYAETCDSHRPGSFSGGVVAVTHQYADMITSGHLAQYFLDTGAFPDLNDE